MHELKLEPVGIGEEECVVARAIGWIFGRRIEDAGAEAHEQRVQAVDVVAAAMKTCDEIDRLESDADRVMRAAVSRLFREEQDVRQLIMHKNVYEYLEEATDKCQDVANVIESVVVENV